MSFKDEKSSALRIVMVVRGPEPTQEVDPDLSPDVNPRIVRISAEDLGQDLLEKSLDHDLPEINLGPGLVRINPGPDPTIASPSPDLVQSLLTHADAKVGQSLKLRVNHAQDPQSMIQ